MSRSAEYTFCTKLCGRTKPICSSCCQSPTGSLERSIPALSTQRAITDFALGASLYFGELIIEHPFVHAGTVKKEFSPVENPRAYREEFLKTVLFFLTVMPFVEPGLVNLIPDPCNFDVHLRDQMLHMATVSVSGDRN